MAGEWDPPEPEDCEEHGLRLPCRWCQADLDDLYADEKIQDQLDNRRDR